MNEIVRFCTLFLSGLLANFPLSVDHLFLIRLGHDQRHLRWFTVIVESNECQKRNCCDMSLVVPGAVFRQNLDEDLHRRSSHRANIGFDDDDIVSLNRAMEVHPIIGSGYDGPATVPAGGYCRRFVNSLH